jgi:hypothetical protein
MTAKGPRRALLTTPGEAGRLTGATPTPELEEAE